ncbi:Iduronate sulfatase [Planctomycetales bacterium 10988]|nr:Iduronate sulfatase [Planctomycetales bacterium 10988]
MSIKVLKIPARLIAGWLGLAVLLCIGTLGQAAEEQAGPNVLLIMSDDLRPQLGCYGDTVVKTPHLDAFAEEALLFENAYVQSAICSPSRNSMLSSLRPHTTGLHGFGTKLREKRPDVVTLPQHFKRNGYHSKALGKIFHIYAESMLGSENDPLSWSEPLQLPTVPVWGPEQNQIRNRLIDEAIARGETFSHPHDWPRGRTWDDSDVPDEMMQDGETAKMAEDFLLERKGNKEPFFLAVGFLRPHLPFNAPKKYWDLYDPSKLKLPEFREVPAGSPPWTVNQGIVKSYYEMPPFESLDEAFLQKYLQAYLACASYVDASAGRVLAALKESGHAENTIVIFVGDHGYQVGEYNSWGHKHANFEISTRAPLIVSTPSLKKPGRKTSQVTEFLDIYPSLCELAGLPIPSQVEGESFAKLLEEPAARQKRAAFSEMFRRGRYGRTVRTDHFRYTEWLGRGGKIQERELFDHTNDQSVDKLETVNVVEEPQYADDLARLSEQLQQTLPFHPKLFDSQPQPRKRKQN